MVTTTTIALLLPACMGIFSCVLMVLSRFNMPAAFAWGLGLGLCALGFATPEMPLSPHVATLASDFFFVFGFFFYAEAFLIHFRQPLYRRGRLVFAAVYLIMNVFVVLKLDSLHLELLLNDLATSCLLGFALVRVMNVAATRAERAVVTIGSIVVIDSLVRVLVFVSLAGASDRIEDFNQSSYTLAMMITTTLIGVLYVVAIAAALADRAIRQLRDVAERDPLTGLLNRRGFDRAMAGPDTGGGPEGAVLVCDIDHFKLVNDRYGHAAGDRVIQALAEALRRCLPANALSARFGGEEFVAFLPQASLAEAGILAQTLRARFGAQDWRHLEIDQQITASFGVAATAGGDHSIDTAIEHADQALYDAKAAGRNRVVWHGGNYEPGGSVIDIQRPLKDEAKRSADGA